MNTKVSNDSVKTIINLLVIVLIFVFFKKILATINSIFGTEAKEREEKKTEEDEQDTISELDKENLTYSKSQYNDFADSIYTALQSSFTEDEDAIYSVFKKLKTNDDFLQLKLSYGQRLIGFWGMRSEMGLIKSLRSLLSDSECKQINYIMANRHITKRI